MLLTINTQHLLVLKVLDIKSLKKAKSVDLRKFNNMKLECITLDHYASVDSFVCSLNPFDITYSCSQCRFGDSQGL
jgi:hypothetical protein